MAQKYSSKTQGDEQFFRRMYDFLYTVTWDDVEDAYKKTIGRLDRRTRWLIVTILASLFLAWALLQLAQIGVSAVQWATRPTIAERLAAPYDLESRPLPLINLDMSLGEGEILAEEPQYLPASISGYNQALTATPGLLEACLLGLADANYGSPCGVSTTPQYMESTTYTNGVDKTAQVVMAQFASDSDAALTLVQMHDYSRSIGRIGNFALLDSRTVDYYYSTTRERFSFSWSNGPWVYTVSSSDFLVLEEIVKQFPY